MRVLPYCCKNQNMVVIPLVLHYELVDKYVRIFRSVYLLELVY